MYVEAHVVFKLNGECHTGAGHIDFTKSVAFSVPLSPSTQYRVSTIPSIVLPHTSPVLVQGSSNPTLLLNLDAKGLEFEGFISAVVILTQDGTANKPEGEQALLIFPDFPDPTPTHPLHPFSFTNTVTGAGGAGTGDVRLAGGDIATSFPRNVTPSVLSTQTNSYTLKIGTISPSFDAGTWTNSNVAQLGGSGAPTLVGSSDTTNKTGSWSFSQATWVSTSTNSDGTRTATYTGSTLTSSSFTGPVTIRTTYGVDADELPNTNIHFSIINPENQAVIFSSVALLSGLDHDSNKLTGTIAASEYGRYGLSTLEMPSSQDSGFVGGSPINYMVILTTRRGTDIAVGEFTYQALPSVRNVQIVTENGQHSVIFDIENV